MTRAVVLSSLLALSAFAADKPRVAILYFDIESIDPDHQVLKKGLCEMLVTDVAADPGLTVVERSRIEEVMAELDLQATRRFDQSTALQVGKLLAADYLVMGTVVSQKVGTRLDFKVVDAEQGKIVGTGREVVKDGDVFDAEARLAEKAVAALAKAGARPAPPPQRKKGSRLSMDHAVKYSQALDALDKKDKKTAKEKLEAVVKAQPDFLLATIELDRLMK